MLHGPLFENFIISDVIKQIQHRGLNAHIYYLRTNHGDEIDLIIDHGINIDLVEIKASHSYRPGFQKTLDKYQFSNSRKVSLGKSVLLLLISDSRVIKTDSILIPNLSFK